MPPNGFNGQPLQFRFRFVSDTSTGGQGVWIDDVNLTGVNAAGLPACDSTRN